MNRDKYLPLESMAGKTKEAWPIPDKLYFRISEVSKLTGLEPYVLRYWESEFKLIKPARTKSRHRLYKRKDLDMVLEIKRLLYEDQYTIAGAKKRLEEAAREDKKTGSESEEIDFKRVVLEILEDLRSLRKTLV
jgi:DNA-binding transcriptional MerR regulator